MEVQGNERFGKHLRRLRERRRLSLDKVEELSTDHLERITRSHLSRIENGQALPTLTRLMTLSRLYGEKLADLVERLEFDIQAESGEPVDVTERTGDELLAEAKIEAERGDLVRAFKLLEAASDRLALDDGDRAIDRAVEIRLKLGVVLLRAGRLSLAAEYIQAALTHPMAGLPMRINALMALAVVHRRQGRSFLSQIMVKEVLSHGEDVPPYHVADAEMILGALAHERGDYREACECWAKSLSLYRELERPYEECRALGNLSEGYLRQGRTGQASRYAELRLEIASRLGFQGQIGSGLQIHARICMAKGDFTRANPLLRQSNEIARKTGNNELLFTNHFHQWSVARAVGDAALASSLRRILGRLRGKIEDLSPEIVEMDQELGEDQP